MLTLSSWRIGETLEMHESSECKRTSILHLNNTTTLS
jgi:hypothetical protein